MLGECASDGGGRHAGANALDVSDPLTLGSTLEPALRHQAGGSLGEIEWFRTSWQRGGAATGYATWRFGDGATAGCVVKVPVGPVERRWAAALGEWAALGWDGAATLSTPRVLASAEALGHYDLCWLVTERFEGKTLAAGVGGRAIAALLEAAADLQARSQRRQGPHGRAFDPDWKALYERSRHLAREGAIPDAARWGAALKQARRLIEPALARWRARPVNAWIHGDLHPANAMWRAAANGEDARCVLIDLGSLRAGHWAEDALYLERQFWGRHERLEGVRPLADMAAHRRAAGLQVDDGYAELADAKRLLAAAAAPANLAHEGDATYLAGALDVLASRVG